MTYCEKRWLSELLVKAPLYNRSLMAALTRFSRTVVSHEFLQDWCCNLRSLDLVYLPVWERSSCNISKAGSCNRVGPHFMWIAHNRQIISYRLDFAPESLWVADIICVITHTDPTSRYRIPILHTSLLSEFSVYVEIVKYAFQFHCCLSRLIFTNALLTIS